MIKKIINVLKLMLLAIVISMSFSTTALAYEYSDGYGVTNEPLTFKCDYYKKEATLVGVDNKIKDLVIPEFYDGCKVTTISRCYCYNVESIFIPSSIITIEEGAFRSWENLRKVIFDERSQIKKIDSEVFRGCVNLISVELPNSVQSIDWCAFFGCDSLTSINLPINIKEIGECAFSNCEDLKSIELNEGLQIIGKYAFENSGLQSINIPLSVKEIGKAAFCNCENLTMVKGILKDN